MEAPSSPTPVPARTSSAGFTAKQSPSPKAARHRVSEDMWHSQNTAESSTSPSNAAQLQSSQNLPARGSSLRNHHPQSSSQAKRRRSSMTTTLIFQETNTWTADKDRLLTGPFDYLHGHPGKDIRSQLISAFNLWLDVPKDSLDIIKGVVGMLHTASLLVKAREKERKSSQIADDKAFDSSIDDVEDSSLLRRGVPVAHSIFGVAQTINSANYVYFRALQELQRLQSPLAIQIFTEELLNLHRGQGMDLYWRDTLTCPSEEDYLEMVDNKTGGLFRLAIKLMQAESRSQRNCVPLANAIGLLFQIQDDYKNLSSVTYSQNKGFAEDLTEGKFSFPIIHSIRADPSNRVLINILKQKTQDDDVKKYAMKYMENTGSFAYTRKVMRELTAKSIKLIHELEDAQDPASLEAAAAVSKILQRLTVDEGSQTPPDGAGGGPD